MAHDHDHGHGHGHGHEHLKNYFTEQLLTLLVVGSMGFVAVRMYLNGMASYILVEQFRVPLFIGGIGVLVLVAIRAVAVWREAGEVQAQLHQHAHGHEHHHHDHAHGHEHHQHDPDHIHGPDCQHEHHDHDHQHAHQHDHGHGHGPGHGHGHDDHGHSHDPAWMFVRMLILVFPVTLFMLGLPNQTMVKALAQYLAQREGAGDLIPGDVLSSLPAVATKPGTVMNFNDLNDAAFDTAKRESMEGQTAVLEGRFNRINDRTFTLFRLKMTCCAADTIPLKVRIVSEKSLGTIEDQEWVRVIGQIRFIEVPGSDGQSRYVPLIQASEVKRFRDLGRSPPSEYE